MNEAFKIWVLKNYKYAWHCLSGTILNEALIDFNKEHKTSLKRFWD